MNRSIQKILIIRLSSLGDVLLASPLIGQLRKKYPIAQIDFLVRTEYADLVRYNPHLNQVLIFEPAAAFGNLGKWRRQIRRSGYDEIIDIHNNLRSRVMTLGIPSLTLFKTRIHRINKNLLIRFLLVKFKVNLYHKIHKRIIPVWEKYLRTAWKLGVQPESGQFALYLPPEAEEKATRFFTHLSGKSHEIAVAPGARHYTKRWPAEYYSELISQLFRKKGWRSILLGSMVDLPVIRTILERVPAGSATSMAGELSILETAAFIRRCRLLVSNDSGLMHVAAAVGTPLIAIFGSTVQELGFCPPGNQITLVENEGLYCRPCSHIGRSACPEKHFRCMQELAPEKILSLVDQQTGQSR